MTDKQWHSRWLAWNYLDKWWVLLTLVFRSRFDMHINDNHSVDRKHYLKHNPTFESVIHKFLCENKNCKYLSSQRNEGTRARAFGSGAKCADQFVTRVPDASECRHATDNTTVPGITSSVASKFKTMHPNTNGQQQIVKCGINSSCHQTRTQIQVSFQQQSMSGTSKIQENWTYFWPDSDCERS